MLLDIGLPKMDGYEVARRLRERPEMENVVLIALTGHSTDADRQHSYEAGFQYHLVKPVPPQHLDEILTVVASEKPASSTLATQ
jgi:CheY-like chemotaxis protein